MSDLVLHWSIPTQFPDLARGDVHVWCGGLDGMADAECLAVLSDDERDRAERYKFDRDRSRFVRARWTLRHLLGHYTKQAPDTLVFGYGKQGKPELLNNPLQLTFNVSHSQWVGLWAFGVDQVLGVDVEWYHRRVDLEKIAKRFFSDREWCDLNGLVEADKKAGFFRCWTQKEAFVKALGDGLTFSLKAFDVAVSGGAQLLRLAGHSDVSDWGLHGLEPAEGFVGALATKGPATLSCYGFVG